LDNLLEEVNDSYGDMLLKELVSRLERTIKEFNEEMNSICGILAKKEKERQDVLAMLRSDVKADKSLKKEKKDTSKEVELNEWEKKLKEIEKG
tara:strand:- start:365 stop:643 length:279 start_codon:yes stop_codon:yes gene_type:complete